MRVHSVVLWGVISVLSGVAGFADTPTNSVPQPELELRVKAGFLYAFAKYVNWPAGTFPTATNAVVIGVVGRDPFGKVLETAVEGKEINGRPVRVVRFARLEDVVDGQILFISEPGLARLRLKKVLTVSDADGFLQRGGQIQFVIENGRVRFDINDHAVGQAGLKLDANLLRVARQVVRRNKSKEP